MMPKSQGVKLLFSMCCVAIMALLFAWLERNAWLVGDRSVREMIRESDARGTEEQGEKRWRGGVRPGHESLLASKDTRRKERASTWRRRAKYRQTERAAAEQAWALETLPWLRLCQHQRGNRTLELPAVLVRRRCPAALSLEVVGCPSAAAERKSRQVHSLCCPRSKERHVVRLLVDLRGGT